MEAGRLEQQVASVDRGIAFLKHEHLAMLTGLQLEITHLKRRCQGEGRVSPPLRLSEGHLAVTHCLNSFFFIPPPLIDVVSTVVVSAEL